MRDDPIAAANSLLAEKFQAAAIAFLAGSVMRGEQNATSDLDTVVLFERLPNAYRDSLTWKEWPVELFVHDSETLRYFCEEECWRLGVPSLPAMISEGVALPRTNDLSKELGPTRTSFLPLARSRGVSGKSTIHATRSPTLSRI